MELFGGLGNMKVLKKTYKAKIENKVVASVRVVGLRVNFLGGILLLRFGVRDLGEGGEGSGGDLSLGLGFIDYSQEA